MNILFYGCLLDKTKDNKEIEEIKDLELLLHDISSKYFIFGNKFVFKMKKSMIETSDVNKGFIEWSDVVDCMKNNLETLHKMDKIKFDITNLDIGLECNWWFISILDDIVLPIHNVKSKSNRWCK